MKTVRIVLEEENFIEFTENGVLVKGEPFHYLKHVMRLKPGENFCITMKGKETRFVVEKVGKNFLQASSLSAVFRELDPLVHVTLAQAVLKSSWMDLIVKSSVELGISRIVPFISARTVPSQLSPQKQIRWQRISREACEQCGRTRMPPVEPSRTFSEIISTLSIYDLVLIAWEKADNNTFPLEQVLNNKCDAQTVCLLVGPEGGFENNEVEQALKAGAYAVTLGKRTLRSETAALAFCALVMYELEMTNDKIQMSNGK